MRSMWTNWLRPRPRTVRRVSERGPSFAPRLEQLGDRIVPAVTASFSAVAGLLEVSGDDADDTITLSRDAAGTILVNGGAVVIDGDVPTVANATIVLVSGLGGNDTITLDETSGALPAVIVFGGDGNDTITGGSGDDTLAGEGGDDTILGKGGADLLLGDDGNDFIDGQQGNDTAFLGAGDDTFRWNPGDGSDTVEGQDGTDRMLFNGANIGETFEVSDNGGRVLFTRNVANITMDLDDVEVIDLNALGGTDTITINDLSGTDLTQFNANFGAAIGNPAGDGSADTIIVNGTNANDVITVSGTGPNAQVVGLPVQVTITGAEPTNDLLRVNALGGDDVIDASQLIAPAIQFLADGGPGNNVIILPGPPAPPVANADKLNVTEDSKNNVLNVLANDTFTPVAGAALTVVSATNPANGTVRIAPDGKSILYTPRVNFVGTDTFSYTVSDGVGGTATATVTVIVQDRPDGAFAIGTGPGVPALAFLIDATTGKTRVAVSPFPGFRGGVSVAPGDVNGDGTPDLIVAAGPGGSSLVKVFDGVTGGQIAGLVALPGFQGGINVAAGDINGDGFADIILSTASKLGVVGVRSGRDMAPLAVFAPFGGIPVGLNVAAGDVNGDGRDDIIVGTASNFAAVGIFNGRDLSPLALLLPFGVAPVGVKVAAGDVNGDGFADLIFGTASGIGFVQVLNGRNMAPLAGFLPFGPTPGGVNVAAEDVNGDGKADIIAGSTTGLSKLATFNGTDTGLLDFALPFGPGSVGGVFVG